MWDLAVGRKRAARGAPASSDVLAFPGAFWTGAVRHTFQGFVARQLGASRRGDRAVSRTCWLLSRSRSANRSTALPSAPARAEAALNSAETAAGEEGETLRVLWLLLLLLRVVCW